MTTISSKRTTTILPLRGIGPRVFISYSFKDRVEADLLAADLTDAGFQVSKEDDTSLVGQRLEEVLPRRIADAECFIVILTDASALSTWVKKELKYAEDRKSQWDAFSIVPVVLSGGQCEDCLGDLAYVDARVTGLSSDKLNEIRSICLHSVRVIYVDDVNPHRISWDNDDDLFGLSGTRKRLVFDGATFWPKALDRISEWGQRVADERHKDGFKKQMKRRARVLEDLLHVIDVVLICLIEQVRSYHERGIVEKRLLGPIVHVFYRIVMVKYLYDNLKMLLNASVCGEEFKAEVELLNGIADDGDGLGTLGAFLLKSKLDKAIDMTLRSVFSELQLSSFSPGNQLTEVSMRVGNRIMSSGRAQRPWVRLRVPDSAVPYLLGNEALPHPTAKYWLWALFCLPQVAVHAIEVAGWAGSRHDREYYDAVAHSVGWGLADYVEAKVVGS